MRRSIDIDSGIVEDEPVALDRADQREADAGVARGRLDDDRAGPEDAARLGVLDHRQGDAVLDAAARVLALELDPDLDARVEEPVDAEVGRVADGVEDGLGLQGALLSDGGAPRAGPAAVGCRGPAACVAAGRGQMTKSAPRSRRGRAGPGPRWTGRRWSRAGRCPSARRCRR